MGLIIKETTEVLDSTFNVVYGNNLEQCNGLVEVEILVARKLKNYKAKTGFDAPREWIHIERVLTTKYEYIL